MQKTSLTIITQNFNSGSYLQLPMLSLYSSFETLVMLKNLVNGRIILIDNASSDNSYDKLCRLGTELSHEKNIDFECIKLEKDLGNSFAISYGFVLERKRGTKYIINMDNDFIILNPYVLEEMIKLAQSFEQIGVKYHAVSSFHIVANRDRFLKSFISMDKTNCETIFKQLRNNILDWKVLGLNITYVDMLNRPIPLFPVIDQEEFYSIVKEVGSLPRFFISAFVPATFTLYNTHSAPLPPFFYILGDDISSGLEHSKRGYISAVLPIVGGIHFVASSQKSNKVRFYFGFRNYLLENPSVKSKRILLKHIDLAYSLIYSILDIVNLKKPLKRRFSPLYRTLSKTFHEGKYEFKESKYAILGTLHAVLRERAFRRKIEEWVGKYIPDTGNDLLEYLRLDFTNWSNGSFSLRKFTKYILLPDKFISREASSRILKKRLRR
ncbi:MAG: glycosyltransferase family A protein [Thermosphaera sp.]